MTEIEPQQSPTPQKEDQMFDNHRTTNLGTEPERAQGASSVTPDAAFAGSKVANRRAWWAQRFAQHGVALYMTAYVLSILASLVAH